MSPITRNLKAKSTIMEKSTQIENIKPMAKLPASLKNDADAGRAFLENFIPRLVKTQLRHAPDPSLERVSGTLSRSIKRTDRV